MSRAHHNIVKDILHKMHKVPSAVKACIDMKKSSFIDGDVVLCITSNSLNRAISAEKIFDEESSDSTIELVHNSLHRTTLDDLICSFDLSNGTVEIIEVTGKETKRVSAKMLDKDIDAFYTFLTDVRLLPLEEKHYRRRRAGSAYTTALTGRLGRRRGFSRPRSRPAPTIEPLNQAELV